EVPPLASSAAEALDRVTIPEDAMAQIADAIATGGSIIVSDQSIKAGGETGQGTEFVVPMR
ncbi:MAG: L,D-transpeptidase, partial [Tardiphaga sp.]